MSALLARPLGPEASGQGDYQEDREAAEYENDEAASTLHSSTEAKQAEVEGYATEEEDNIESPIWRIVQNRFGK